MPLAIRYVLPALMLGAVALAVGFFDQRSEGTSGHNHSALVPADIAEAATHQTTTIEIERADGRVDEFALEFKAEVVERSGDVILVSGSANGVFADMYPIQISPGDRLLRVTPALDTDVVPDSSDARPTATPRAGGEDPRDAVEGGAESTEGVNDGTSIVDTSPKIGPDGPEPPVTPQGVQR